MTHQRQFLFDSPKKFSSYALVPASQTGELLRFVGKEAHCNAAHWVSMSTIGGNVWCRYCPLGKVCAALKAVLR